MIERLIMARSSLGQRQLIAPYSQQFGLSPADRLIEPIFQTGFSKHHSIYLGVDAQGREWVAENHWLNGVRIIDAKTFFKPRKQIQVKPFAGTRAQRQAAVKRALDQLGKPYDLISYNCEHYAHYVQTGSAISKQIEDVVEGLKTAAVGALAIVFLNALLPD